MFTDVKGNRKKSPREGEIISLQPPQPKPRTADAQAPKEGLLCAGRGDVGTVEGPGRSTGLCPGEGGGGKTRTRELGAGRGERATGAGKPAGKKEISGVGRENGGV